MDDLLARRDEPPPERGRPLGVGRRAGHTREEAALAEVGQQPRQPRRARRPEALLALPDQVDQRARAVEQLEQRRVVVREPQVGVAGEVAQHPAARPLVGVHALQRVARPHARAHPVLRRLRRRAGRGHDERRARADDERPARLGELPPPLHAELLVPDADPRAVAQRERPLHPRAVHVGAVARARVLDLRRAFAGGDPGMRARDARVVEAAASRRASGRSRRRR